MGGAVLLLGGAAFAFTGASEPQSVPARGVAPSALAQERGVPSTTPRRPSSLGRASSLPAPPTPEEHRAQTAPPPPRPPAPQEEHRFTEADARAALAQVRIDMYATTWCGSCRRARTYLSENGIAYTEYDIEADDSANARLAEINPQKSIPTFQIDDIVQIGFSPENMEYKLNEAVRKRLYQ